MHVKSNDSVIILAGRDRGKQGKVKKIITKTGRVLVEKINMVKRHQRPNNANRTGGIVEKEAPLDLSNVALYCPTCAKGVRTTRRYIGEGNERYRTPVEAQQSLPDGSVKRIRKIRICVHCGHSFDL